MQAQPLSQTTLSSLPKNISVPGYDRQALQSGIVHVGVGGFHRSHQAFYTENYLNQTQDLRWGICGIGLREADRAIQQKLAEQDFLYSLLVKHPNGQTDVQVIGCMTDFLLAPDDPEAVINQMAADETRIVSLTITEGGYNCDPSTGEFDLANPDVQHDIANPDKPRLIFGYLAAALQRRRAAGKTPFTIQSCDNVQHNGDVTRKMLVSYINAYDSEFAQWVNESVRFPNAMVDRITPATTEGDISLAEQLGIIDQWPVTCEPFHQWVIEDKFTQQRPRWEQVGAQIVSDVTPYETMKIRLLNAGHTVLGVLGSLRGHQTIEEAISDPIFARYLRAFMDNEVTPVLDAVPGINLDEYKQTLISRFANPNIKDNLTRICSQSSTKVATFLVPTIQQNLQRKGSVKLSSLVLAAWCWYSNSHTTQNGESLDVIDDLADTLQQAAQASQKVPLVFLSQQSIFGPLASNKVFCEHYQSYLTQLFAGEKVEHLMASALECEVAPVPMEATI